MNSIGPYIQAISSMQWCSSKFSLINYIFYNGTAVTRHIILCAFLYINEDFKSRTSSSNTRRNPNIESIKIIKCSEKTLE